MSYEKVLQAQKLIIGTKQTVKELKQGVVNELIVAEDADPHIIEKVTQAAKEAGVPITTVDSKVKLGKKSGIDVGASTVAISK